MCKIKLTRNWRRAKEAFLTAWETAKPDGLLEAFIEHHGLLQGDHGVLSEKGGTGGL